MNKGLICLVLFLAVATSASAFVNDFEAPTYTTDSAINGVDGWTQSGGGEAQAIIQSTYVHSGTQALGIQQSTPGASVALLKDFENTNTWLKVEYWAMPGDTTDATGAWIAIEQDRSTAKRSALFGFRSGKIAYNKGGGWINSTTAYTAGQWYKLTGILDYSTKTWDFYVNDSLFASDLGFYHAAHTTANNVRLYKGTNNLGMVVDDLTVVPEPSSLLALFAGATGLAGMIRRRK